MIIGIDHGYYAIKTRHCSFPAGLTCYGSHEPYTRQSVLEVDGQFYVCGTGRQPVRCDKTENDTYYLLTLAALAQEIKMRGAPNESSVKIAAGLPLTSFGRDKPKFRQYLLRSQPVLFRFEGTEYKIAVEDVALFPQGYAALLTDPDLLLDEPSLLLMDIGGWTVDLMRIDNARPVAETAHSLEFGMIRCIDAVREQVRRETGLSLTDAQIEQIADNVLDACLAVDPAARVACEALATRGHIVVAGEISTTVQPDVFNITRDVVRGVGYDPKAFQIDCWLHAQSPDIAGAVNVPLDDTDPDALGAGDQGIVVGYACKETPQFMPLPVVLAHRLTSLLTLARMTDTIHGIGPDGKAQVTVEYAVNEPEHEDAPLRVSTVVLSVQHAANKNPDELAQELTEQVIAPALRGQPVDDTLEILINPSGSFVLGGPEADTGLTGRKLAVDAYGPFAPHGGGALSGKDPTKVDRSGAYMARYIAKNLVAAGIAERCQVTLAYAIGMAEPVMVEVDTFGTCPLCADDCLAKAVRQVFDLTPAGIIETLDLQNPFYARTAVGGHFGREDFPWERVDKVGLLLNAIL